MKSIINLSVSTDNSNCLELKVLDSTPITQHGFGLFFEGYNPEQIAITDDAKKKLLTCGYKSGLQGMEFFSPNDTVGNILAWGQPSGWLDTPFDAISVHPGADKVIKSFAKLEQ